MKRIILLCLLTTSAFARPLTDFVEPNGRIYAFVECDTVMLDILIPVGIKWSAVPTGEFNAECEPITRQKNLREYIFSHMIRDLGNGRSVILLAAKEASDYRNHGVTLDDLYLWEMYLTPYGYGSDVWKTLDEWRRNYPQDIV